MENKFESAMKLPEYRFTQEFSGHKDTVLPKNELVNLSNFQLVLPSESTESLVSPSMSFSASSVSKGIGEAFSLDNLFQNSLVEKIPKEADEYTAINSRNVLHELRQESIDSLKILGQDPIFTQKMGEVTLESVLSGEKIDHFDVIAKAYERYQNEVREGQGNLGQFVDLAKTCEMLVKKGKKERGKTPFQVKLEGIMQVLDALAVRMQKLSREYEKEKNKFGEEHPAVKALENTITQLSYTMGYVMGYTVVLAIG